MPKMAPLFVCVSLAVAGLAVPAQARQSGNPLQDLRQPLLRVGAQCAQVRGGKPPWVCDMAISITKPAADTASKTIIKGCQAIAPRQPGHSLGYAELFVTSTWVSLSCRWGNWSKPAEGPAASVDFPKGKTMSVISCTNKFYTQEFPDRLCTTLPGGSTWVVLPHNLSSGGGYQLDTPHGALSIGRSANGYSPRQALSDIAQIKQWAKELGWPSS